jgi:hypothetical protein
MKRWILGSFVFTVAVTAGMVTVYLVAAYDVRLREGKIQSCPAATQPEISAPNTPELTNVRIPAEFESGEFHHFQPVFDGSATLGKCELNAETKGPWLGLYKNGNQYSLETTKVRFGRSEKDDFGTFIPMYFGNSKNAVFLISHANEIKPGLVTTLYALPAGGNGETLLGSGYRRDFVLGEEAYLLRIASGTTETGGPVEVLLLESNGKSDMLYFRSQQYGERNFGEVEWVGDLDSDNRLDLLFSFFAQNGGGKRYILFLSSQAKTNHLVQPFAFFDTRFRGC